VSDVKIFVKLYNPDLPDAESMRAEPLPQGRFRILNVPFYARDFALGDVVSAEYRDGILWFKDVVDHSGNGVIRIFCRSGFDTSPGSDVVADLEAHGYIFEFLDKLAAASIPAHLGEDHLEWLEGYLKPHVSDDCFYEIPVW
jgi:hypothetical protein